MCVRARSPTRTDTRTRICIYIYIYIHVHKYSFALDALCMQVMRGDHDSSVQTKLHQKPNPITTSNCLQVVRQGHHLCYSYTRWTMHELASAPMSAKPRENVRCVSLLFFPFIYLFVYCLCLAVGLPLLLLSRKKSSIAVVSQLDCLFDGMAKN